MPAREEENMAPEEQNYPDPNYPTKDLGPDPLAQGAPDDEAEPESEAEAEEEVVEEEGRGAP
jgi:hypothetical protein